MMPHDITEINVPVIIVVIILQRLAHGFPHCLKTCKMDDRINFLLVKHFFKGRLVQKVCLVELYLPACYLPYSLQCLLAGVIKLSTTTTS